MIEQHVTSLSVSKALHEAGLELEHHYVWYYGIDTNTSEYKKIWEVMFADDDDELKIDECVPAYLATELLEWMPKEKILDTRIYHDGENHCVAYYNEPQTLQQNKSLPDALGKMCLYLLENNLATNEKSG